MTDEEGFGRKGIGLHVDIGTGDLVHKRRLADVGQAAHEEGAGVGVEGREAAHVLADLLEVGQTGLLPFEDGAHPTEGGALQALAPVERVAVLDHPDHVAGDGIAQRAGGVDLTQGELILSVGGREYGMDEKFVKLQIDM